MANKTYIQFAIDSNSSMFAESKINIAFGFVIATATQLVVKDSKTTEIGLVTFGDFNRNGLIEMNRASAGSMCSLENLEAECKSNFENSSKKHSDENNSLFDGISTAEKVLLTKKLTATASRVLVVITDGSAISADAAKSIKRIIPSLQENKCCVYVIRLKATSGQAVSGLNHHDAILQELANTTTGRYLEARNVSDCLPIFASAPGLTVTPRLTKINMQISPALVIPCAYFGMVTKVPLPTLKKQAKPSINAPAAAGVTIENGMNIEDMGGGGVGWGGVAKRDTSYRNPDDPDEEIVAEDRVKGYKYGSQYIPISSTEEEAFKVAGPAIIEVLGFVDASSIPRHHFLDGTTILQGDVSSSSGPAATVAIAALSSAMRSANQVALARFVKKENSDPIMAALVPASFHNGTLLLHRLPFVEDYRDYSFPSLPTHYGSSNTAISSIQFAAMSGFIDSITIVNPSATQICPFNPTLRTIQSAIGKKLREASAALTGNDVGSTSSLDALLFPDPLTSLVEKECNEASAVDADAGNVHRSVTMELYKKLMTEFPLAKKEAKDDKKRSYWSDIRISSEDAKRNSDGIVQITVNADYDSQPNKKPSTGATESTVSYEGPILSAGSVTPSEDFQAVIDYRERTVGCSADQLARIDEEVVKSMDTLQKIISLMISVGGTQAHYRKAVACIKVYRVAAVKCGQFQLFNTFLTSIKQQYSSGRQKAMWDLMRTEPPSTVTLIAASEDGRSTVSDEDAVQFFTTESGVVMSAAPVAAPEPEDDLFDDMA